MTLKYESELLFDLMKRDGDDAPSDVLPYESELKEKYLEQVEGAYPKLQDYRPEWLYYNLYYRIPSDFPVESVVNVTSTIFYDVVPYSYRSAILKGQTLVNLWGTKREHFFANGTFENSVLTSNDWCCLYRVEFFKPNTEYTLITNIISISDTNTYFKANNVASNGIFKTETNELNKTGIYVEKVVSYDDFTGREFSTRSLVSGGGTIQFNMVVLEGDYTNVDIPYFEGMQSVKMPVLTTSNEDGTKSIILTVNDDVTLRGIGDVKDELNCLTGEVVEHFNVVTVNGNEKWTIASTSDDTLMRFYTNDIIGYPNGEIICDKFNSFKTNMTNREGVILWNSSGNLNIVVSKSKLTEESTNGFKQYLSNNPLTVQYQLTTESIKTVDLSCINEQGKSATFRPIEGTMHVNTSSQTLLPLLDMSVPVEATTQNLMSFANIVEEE